MGEGKDPLAILEMVHANATSKVTLRAPLFRAALLTVAEGAKDGPSLREYREPTFGADGEN